MRSLSHIFCFVQLVDFGVKFQSTLLYHFKLFFKTIYTRRFTIKNSTNLPKQEDGNRDKAMSKVFSGKKSMKRNAKYKVSKYYICTCIWQFLRFLHNILFLFNLKARCRFNCKSAANNNRSMYSNNKCIARSNRRMV